MATASTQQASRGTWTSSTRFIPAPRFAVKHMVVATFRGRFEKLDATLTDGEDGSAADGTVDVASIVVKDENLAAHLQSPDFFDAERHPELRFESTRDPPTGDGDELVVDGELTIKGITKPVEARGTLDRPPVTLGDVDKVGLDARGDHRSHRVRPELERAAAQGRLRARQRRHAHRRARARGGQA